MTEIYSEEWYKQRKMDENTKPFMQLKSDTGVNALHIQAYSPKDKVNGAYTNREYGYAERFSVPPVVAEALKEYIDTRHLSLATESEDYYRDLVSVHSYIDGVQLHLLVPHDTNNADGLYILDLPFPRFLSFINYLEKADLLITHDDEYRFIGTNMEDEE